jgi:hypothetical protein
MQLRACVSAARRTAAISGYRPGGMYVTIIEAAGSLKLMTFDDLRRKSFSLDILRKVDKVECDNGQSKISTYFVAPI